MRRPEQHVVVLVALVSACAETGVNCPCLPSHASLCTAEQLAACPDAATDGGSDAGNAPSDAGLAAGSCDHRATAAGYCEDTEVAPLFIDSFRMTCVDGGGTWTDAACPRAGSIGACRTDLFGGPDSQTRWFYEGGPVPDGDTLRASCEAEGRTYVAP